ncbi:MAG: preprotein translocase subunit SecE, partial [Eubacteriales bacterium]|nr:preprotein translocase subunit SecE [Eubacteriales bacterium]
VRKIVWPTRQQTLNNVLVVIAAVLIVGVFVWVLDLVFGGVVAAVIGMLGG